MDKIEVKVIAEHGNPAAMMSFLARLTQRGANITSMSDLESLMDKPASDGLVRAMVGMDNHKTIRRFTPITVAIVGASRRFLAQIRTHSVGLNFVSASLQYSDYSGKGRFVVPYAIMEKDVNFKDPIADVGILGAVPNFDTPHRNYYLDQCEKAMNAYEIIAKDTDNDTAGYVAPQGLRNILIIQGNHDAWLNMIKLRTCNRNTVETQYVVLRIWEELLKTQDGEAMLEFAGPDCAFGGCKEGKFCCGEPWRQKVRDAKTMSISLPRHIIDQRWPLLKGSN